MRPKVLFICKKRLSDYGNSSGLFNSANFIANFLNSKGISAKAIVVQDANSIDREVTSFDPTHVVIEAIWVTVRKFRELLSLNRHQCRYWVVRIHSKIPFLANEGVALSWLNDYFVLSREFQNFIVAPNSKEVADDLRDVIHLNTIYLPNIYLPTFSKSQKYKKCLKKSAKFIDVGCFGAIRPMKNQLIQAVAAIKFAEKLGKTLRFHINVGRQEQKGDQVYKNLRALFNEKLRRHKLIEHPWASHDDFISIIKQVDIGMQVSLSETFNIVTADLVNNGIPVVGSPEIDWLPYIFKVNPSSSTHIEFVLMFTYIASKSNLHYLNNLYLHFHNEYAEEKWLNFLCYE